MAETTTGVELDAQGSVIVVKRAVTPEGSERIEREARILEAARHPGVVELVATVDPSGAPAVVTRWVGPHTLTAVSRPALAQAAGILVALAECVADLHGLGIVHGAITADHVILSQAGQPVLCGFGGAELTLDDVARTAAIEDDVAALGQLLRMLAGDETDLEPIPEWRGWRRKPRWQGYQRRALLTLADQATNDQRELRPTARALAAAIHDTIPDARIGPVAAPPDIPAGDLPEPDPPATSESHDSPSVENDDVTQPFTISVGQLPAADLAPISALRVPSRRAITIVAGVLGVGLLLYGISQMRASRAARRLPGQERSAAPATTIGTAQKPMAAPRSAPADRCPHAATGAVDLDADGCPDPVRVTKAVVEAAGTHYAIGQRGDRVVVADWRCDGRATPAVLRPATGEVFVFPRWATPGRDITIKPTSRVPRASVIEAGHVDRNGCPELMVRTSAGDAVVIHVRHGS